MKNGVKLFCTGALVALAGLTSCDKKSDPEPSRTSLLMSKQWILTASTTTYTNGGASETNDEYAEMDACEKDDLIEFKADSVLVHSEGATKCDTESPDSYQEKWRLSADEKQMMVEDDETTLTFDIMTLTDSKLEMQASYNFMGGTVTSKITFAKK